MELSIETRLNVELVLLGWSLLLLDEEFFHGVYASAFLILEILNLWPVPGVDLLERLFEDVTLESIGNDIHFCSKTEQIGSDELTTNHDVPIGLDDGLVEGAIVEELQGSNIDILSAHEVSLLGIVWEETDIDEFCYLVLVAVGYLIRRLTFWH